MALEFRLDGSGDLVPRKLFKVRAGDDALFVRCRRLHGRGPQGFRLPIIGTHSVDAGFGVVALHPANRHERAEGVEDVLAEVRPGNSLTNPFHRPPVVIGVWTFRLEVVVADNFTEVDHWLGLERNDDKITVLDFMSKRPDLTCPVLDRLGLRIRVDAPHEIDKFLSVMQLAAC